MRRNWVQGMLVGLLWIAPLPAPAQAGWIFLKWMEAPSLHGPSTLARPEDRTEFLHALSFHPDAYDESSWQVIKQSLKEGDLIAYREETWPVRLQILLMGRLNKIPYDLFKYGHLAIVVKDPDDENRLRLLSSWSFRGPNILESVDTLKNHSWDSYRLNHWDRVDEKLFYEFIRLVREKAEKWYGYDFSGMFGLWNSNLRPIKPAEIGHAYTCSTVILAALYYSGVELDAYQRYGIADIVTPLQLISSKGRIVGTDKETSGSSEFGSVLSGNTVAEEPGGEAPEDEG